MLQIIPAIDIMDGQLVRLTKGDPSTRQGYQTKNPMDAAMNWAQQGAEMIHIIDLDAALGKTSNSDQILEIVGEIDAPLQVGGGIRRLETARRLLDGGVQRIILGSMPIKAPMNARMLLREYGPDRIVIALDHKDGYLMVKGWQESTNRRLSESLRDFKEQGYRWFLVTNIDHDGTLEGPDTETYKEISKSSKIIASGGVSNLTDITRLKTTGVKAVVVGKALYENRFTLAEAKEATNC